MSLAFVVAELRPFHDWSVTYRHNKTFFGEKSFEDQLPKLEMLEGTKDNENGKCRVPVGQA